MSDRRNTLVQASFEGKNNLNKGKVMTTIKDKEKFDRKYQKTKIKKMMEDL